MSSLAFLFCIVLLSSIDAAPSDGRSISTKSESILCESGASSIHPSVATHHIPRTNEKENEVPVIDLSEPDVVLVREIAKACSTWGFFQVVNHGIPLDLMAAFREQMESFFDLTPNMKTKLKRDEGNSRGYFDDELTKQRKDWKEGLDIGMPGSRDWSLPDNAGTTTASVDGIGNACLDGFNRFPDPSILPKFRSTFVQYYQACERLSDRIAILMSIGLRLGDHSDDRVDEQLEQGKEDPLLQNLRHRHSSYLRMNYYPSYSGKERKDDLGISPHRDAGFLTVLLQDDNCHSLQVAKIKDNVNMDDNGSSVEWKTIRPVPGSLTINTGDMAMIYSNGKYRAPLHRVLTNDVKKRYSAPFFYNPGYDAMIAPLTTTKLETKQPNMYHPCSWGYFRAVRFAGDLTDLGVEIQTSDYAISSSSEHPLKQKMFLKNADFRVPFSVEKYRPLLERF